MREGTTFYFIDPETRKVRVGEYGGWETVAQKDQGFVRRVTIIPIENWADRKDASDKKTLPIYGTPILMLFYEMEKLMRQERKKIVSAQQTFIKPVISEVPLWNILHCASGLRMD